MKVWPGWIATFTILDEGSDSRTEIFATCNRFLLTGPGCRTQTGHIDMQHRPGKYPGHFMIAIRPMEGKIYDRSGSYFNVHYKNQKKVVLARTLEIESFILPPFSM